MENRRINFDEMKDRPRSLGIVQLKNFIYRTFQKEVRALVWRDLEA
jgi:hypothetical protein